MMNYILYLLFALSCLSNPVSASDREDTIRVLFIGNSYVYYNNLAQLTMVLSDSMSTKLICTKSTLGGANLGDHWNSRRGLETRELLDKNRYDVIVLQDNSMWPLEHPDSVLYYGKLFCDLVKKNAKVFLYNTWARKNTPQTQEQINSVYENLAANCQATLVPAGTAWAVMKKKYPDAELYHSDGSHPSYYGTFLVSLCMIKKITGKLPGGYARVYNYTDKDGELFRIMQVSDEEIKRCIEVVNEVISSK